MEGYPKYLGPFWMRLFLLDFNEPRDETKMQKRYTERQIAFALRQAAGTPVAEIVRMMEISEQTFYRLKREPGR
jgi:DNA invertase Pin-like site-specific DNA recombinase